MSDQPSKWALAAADDVLLVFERYLAKSMGVKFADPEHRPRTVRGIAVLIEAHSPNHDREEGEGEDDG